MKILIPEQRLLHRTGPVDYIHWCYQFPIKYIYRYRLRKIASLLGDKHYPALLEAGTGSGIFLPELSRHCSELYAIDIHEQFDGISRMLDFYHIKDYHLTSRRLEETGYPVHFFDAIVAVSVLEFVTDLSKSIAEIKRILKPGGIFVTICPMENKLLDTLLSIYSDKHPAEEFGTARSRVIQAIEESFRIIKKGYMIPFAGEHFPIYTYFKLST